MEQTEEALASTVITGVKAEVALAVGV